MGTGREGRGDSASRRFQPQAGALDAVLAASPDLVYLCDRGGAFLYANHPGAREWGMDRGEILGRNWTDLGLPGDVLDRLASLRERAFDTGQAQVEMVPIPMKRGIRECECLLTPIQGDGGAVEVVVIAFRDVSGSKRAERALSESEENYRLLAENSTDMISRHDPQGRYLYVSPACRVLLGYEPEELLGHSAYEFIHPDDRPAIGRVPSTILGYPQTRTIVFRVRRKPGDYLWFETTSRTIRAPESGEVVEIQCSSRDVTARKLAEDALRENRELLQAVLDNTTALIFVKDEEGRYILVNRRFEALFNISRHRLAGKTDYELFPGELAEVLHRNDRQVLEAGEPIVFEEVVPHPDGVHTYLSIKFPIPRSFGATRALCGISTDITERKRAEEQLRLQYELLEQAIRSERQIHEALKRAEGQLVQAEKLTALGQMVAGVAHEINNPLAFVTNNITVLRREVRHLLELIGLFLNGQETLAAHQPELHAQIRERAERIDLDYVLSSLDDLIDRSGEGLRRIRQIVKDLRDFARLDEGDLKEVDLNEGIVSTVNIILGRAKTQGVELDMDLAPLPLVTCYPGKVNQVVLNLLSNAIDACSGGGKVTVRTRADSDTVSIHVLDTGHGIPAAIRDKIFDPFFTTKPVGQGTGLGLSISYGIVQSHEGRIDVHSNPGEGTEFVVRIPIAGPRPAAS
ncbi:MAG TPA: PAS domain S-box protein [Isosphaeraceae bacterium]|nr:PAS domain S-box protein [Isosphaeraceae bacterium]